MGTSIRKVDDAISLASEGVARRLTRRSLIGKVLKVVPISIAGASVGSLTRVTDVFADCTCHYIAFCNGSCPSGGCPSGYVACCSGYCSGCIYSTCQWTACSGQGTCGQGYEVCTDCRPSSGGCSGACTCKSSCICCGCCTPQDIAAAHAGLVQALNN